MEEVGAGVTINPIAFIVIERDNVKLMPVNHASSLDKLLDYMPDLIEKANSMINRCMQNKKEETKEILKEMQNKHEKNMKKMEEDKKNVEKKIEKEAQKAEKQEQENMDMDETYEVEYDKTLEDE